MKKWLDSSIWKFLIVGVVNTLIGTIIMFVFYNLFGFGYWISTASNYIVGSIVSYILNKKFTFKSRKNSFQEIGKFVIHIALCYLIAYGFAKPFIGFLLSNETVQLQENFSMVIGMGLFVCLNYIGQKWFVFK